MAGFRYQAIDASGRIHKGVLETDSQRQVRALLREQGLTAVEVEGLTQQSDLPGKKTTRASSRKRLPGKSDCCVSPSTSTAVKPCSRSIARTWRWLSVSKTPLWMRPEASIAW